MVLAVLAAALLISLGAAPAHAGSDTRTTRARATDDSSTPAQVGGTDPCASVPDHGTLTPAWQGVKTLLALGQKDQASKSATAIIAKTGELPGDHATCEQVVELYTPKHTAWPVATAKSVGDALKTWWWLIAILIAVLLLFLARLVTRPAQREKPPTWWRPKVSFTINDALDAATGLTVGARFSATVHARIDQLDDEQVGGAKFYVDAADAVTDALPLDELPSQAQWFVKLYTWWNARNRLRVNYTLASTRTATVSLAPAILEQNGSLTTDTAGTPQQTTIEQPASQTEPVASDYLKLTHPAFAWTVFTAKALIGDDDHLDAEFGTPHWPAYALFLEGAAALRDGDVITAHRLFSQARLIDNSTTFLEVLLNDGYALAQGPTTHEWLLGLATLQALAPLETQ